MIPAKAQSRETATHASPAASWLMLNVRMTGDHSGNRPGFKLGRVHFQKPIGPAMLRGEFNDWVEYITELFGRRGA